MTRPARGAAVALVAVLAGCGSDDDAGDTAASVTDATVTVTDAWARTTPAGATTGAVYLTLESDVDEELRGVVVDPTVAAAAELHMTMTGGDGTSMMPLGDVPLPAGEAVAFAPNGDHVMLVELAAPLEAGTAFAITLQFAGAPDQVVTVPVSDDAP